MKKAKLLFITLLAVLGWGQAAAETVSPYTVDFNTQISTESHDFAVSSNWGHVVDSYEDYWGDASYASYSFSSDEGKEGSGALKALTNQKSNNMYDLLVTPLVSGTVTLYVKPVGKYYNDTAFLEFYSMNEAGTEKNEVIATTNFSEKTNSEEWDWYALTVTLETPQRIGIRASQVFIDDFSATSAEIVPQKMLKVISVMNSDEQTGYGGTNPVFYQDEEGNTLVQLKAKIQNTGDVDLVSGTTENYTLTLAEGTSYSISKYFEDAAFAISVDLAAGETKVVPVEFYVPASTGWTYFYIRENVTGSTSSSYRYAQVMEYASKFIFDVSGTTSSRPTTTPMAFGKINEAKTLNYEIYNSGSAPLVINSLTVPVPFTTNAPTGEFTVAGGEKKQISFTLPADNYGVYAGDLTINYTNFGKEAAEYTLAMSGTVLDPSKNMITFDNGENGQFPAGSIHSDNVYISSETTGDVTNYYLQSTSTTTKFITPLLTAQAGESFTFDTWYKSYSDYAAVKVYTSVDRVNWTEVKNYTDINSSPSTCTVTLGEAGDYYLAFELLNNALLDNIYGLTLAAEPEHDWYGMGSDIPATGKQNATYTASVSIKNISATEDIITKAILYVDGEAVAESNDITLPGNDKTAAVGTGRNDYSNIEDPVEISLSFKPHMTGELPVYIELMSGDSPVFTSESVNVNFEEEVVESDLDMAGKGATTTGLLSLNWNNSESVNLYSADVLADLGIKAGDKIKSFFFKGYKETEEYTTTLNVWYEFTDDTKQAKPADGIYDTDGMTNALTETHTWKKEGSSNELVDMVVVNFDEPIVYEEGKSLRVVVRSEATSYKQAYFEYSTISGEDTSYNHKNDNASTFQTQSWSETSYLPAIHISLDVEPKTFSGNVYSYSDSCPIPGATVTLCSTANDVEYTAVADENGEFSMGVVQDNLTYDVVNVTADGFEDNSIDVELSFTNGNQEGSYGLNPKTYDLTISESTYATFYYEKWNMRLPDEVTAYAVKALSNKEAVLEEVGQVIPAGVPVVLHSSNNEGTYYFSLRVTTEQGVAPESNLLIGSEEGGLFDEEGYKYYVLCWKDANKIIDEVGFYYQANSQGKWANVAPHQAFIKVAEGEASANGYAFDGTNSIETVGQNAISEADNVYTVSGVRVKADNLKRGIYIVNGKKVVVK